MYPVSPVIPAADADETVYAEQQSEYVPLPSVRTPEGIVLTRWKISDEEKRQIVEQGYVYLTVHTFNQPLQPVMITTFVPPDLGFETRPLEEWPNEVDA